MKAKQPNLKLKTRPKQLSAKMLEANTLAYYKNPQITAVKSCLVQAQLESSIFFI
jgi:hypothetical protein